MRIAAIGDSHSAAIKTGYESVRADHASVEMVFFAARSNIIFGLIASDGVLAAPSDNTLLATSIKNTSGGSTEIRPNDFDMFLFIGLSRDIFKLVHAVRGPYSTEAQRRAICDHWRRSSMVRLIRKLRSISDKPVYVCHAPLPAAPISGAQGVDDYVQLIALSNKYVFSELGCQLIAQPTETIVNQCRTNLVYAKGSRRLAAGHPNDDTEHDEAENSHMNQQYGALWLNAFLDGVGKAP